MGATEFRLYADCGSILAVSLLLFVFRVYPDCGPILGVFLVVVLYHVKCSEW